MTPDQLQSILEWAGAKFLSLPSIGLFPSKPKASWPDYSQDIHELLSFRRKDPPRPALPSPSDVSLMEEIIWLPHFCQDIVGRKILYARLLVNPINDRHLYSWSSIAKRIRLDPRSVKYRHRQSLKNVLFWAPAGDLKLIEGKFTFLDISVNCVSLKETTGNCGSYTQ